MTIGIDVTTAAMTDAATAVVTTALISAIEVIVVMITTIIVTTTGATIDVARMTTTAKTTTARSGHLRHRPKETTPMAHCNIPSFDLLQMSNFKNKLGLNWSARKSNKVVFFSSPLIPRFTLS
jgi:hypothetical protein